MPVGETASHPTYPWPPIPEASEVPAEATLSYFRAGFPSLINEKSVRRPPQTYKVLEKEHVGTPRAEEVRALLLAESIAKGHKTIWRKHSGPASVSGSQGCSGV